MARGLGSVASLINGFNAGYDTTGRVLRDIDIAKITAAKPEQVAVPAPEATDPTDITTPQAKTTFLGQTLDKADDASIARARQLAMAGVLEKHGDVMGGQALRERIAQQSLNEERAAREREQAPLQLESLRVGLGNAQRQARLGDRAEKTALETDALNKDMGEWMRTRLANPDGTQRAPTPDDYLASTQYRASKLFEAGKPEEAAQAMQQYHATASAKIALDTAERTQAIGKTVAALGSGDLGAVKDFYNRFVPDGAKVTDVQRGKDGSITVQRMTEDGKPLPPTLLKNADQLSAVLQSFTNPGKLYEWSQGEFQRTMQLRADARGAAADGRAAAADRRAQAEFDLLAPEREARGEAGKLRVEASKLDLSTPEGRKRDEEIQGRLRALSTGTKSAGGGADPAAVKSAQALVAAGQYPDLGTALEGVINKPDQTHKGFVEIGLKNMMKPEEATKAADQAMAAMGWSRNGTRWTKAASAAAAPAGAPQKGAVVDGYVFQGGDPKDKNNWKPK